MHWLANFLLAILVFFPIKDKKFRAIRLLVGLTAAVALLHWELGLQSWEKLLTQAQLILGFSFSYIQELIGRLVSWRQIAFAFFALLVYVILAKRIRFATLAFISILLVGFQSSFQAASTKSVVAVQQSYGDTASDAGTGAQATPDILLTRFFERENQRKLTVQAVDREQHPFDIVILQVCSLAWDDVEYVGLSQHPLLTQAQLVFSQFNSATSYSGPASIRLLHGMCGQTPHKNLYDNADPACYVFPTLEKMGYQTQALLNHDGVYDNFAKELENLGGLSGKLQSNKGFPQSNLLSFDNTQLYNDYGMLHQWLQSRPAQAAGAAPAALYYNTISLHDGVHAAGSSAGQSLATYKPRLQNLLDDFSRFIAEVKSSGRPTVVLMLPEHGANLRGDAMQIPGMREIPTPRITLVPALAYVLNGAAESAPTVRVDKAVSYNDVFALLGNMLSDSPFKADPTTLEHRLQILAGTDFVNDSDSVTMLRTPDRGYLMRAHNSPTWVPYQP